MSDSTAVAEDNESRRKRIKTENDLTPEAVNNDISDELNDAFQHSICDDDVIEPTQFGANESGINKTALISPGKKGRRVMEHNKENEQIKTVQKDVSPFDVKEKSPTMLGKRFNRIDLKKTDKMQQKPLVSVHSNVQSPVEQNLDDSMRSESPKWHSKPRRLFDNWSSSSHSSPQQQEQNKSTRKKLSLPRASSRLKQSTIKFPKVCPIIIYL